MTAIATALLGILPLRKQLKQAQTDATSQTVATLSSDQQTKLHALAGAAKLQPAIQQATGLGLLVPPQGGPGGAQ